MFSTVLIALDLSPAEQPILDCIPGLKAWGVERVVLCHVVRVGYAQGGDLANAQDYRDWLDRCAQPLRASGLETSVEICSGGVVADEILATAARINADLVVIGSRGHNIVNRLFLGSVARDVLRKAALPVLLEWIEPTAEATQARCEAVCKETLRHVVVATDFSSRAAAAERAALQLAARSQRIDGIHIVPRPDPSSWQLSDDATKAALNDLAMRLRTAGGKGDALLFQGKASQEVARYAGIHDISLIIVGKHGRGWVADNVIGSTAAKVCEMAGRPVLMVP